MIKTEKRERLRDRETERQRDRETERQRERIPKARRKSRHRQQQERHGKRHRIMDLSYRNTAKVQKKGVREKRERKERERERKKERKRRHYTTVITCCEFATGVFGVSRFCFEPEHPISSVFYI